MDNYPDLPLLESHSYIKCMILGYSCIFTLMAFIYGLYKFVVSNVKIARLEFSIFLLSSFQLIIGIIFYFGSQDPFILLLNKAIKVIQCELISWAYLLSLFINRSRYKRFVCMHVLLYYIVYIYMF